MTRRVIFLDVDGVLNSASEWFGLPKATGIGTHEGSRVSPRACALVQQLAEALDAQIVVSSTWRVGKTHRQLGQMFKPFGLDPARIVDVTPNLVGNDQTRGDGGLIVCYSNRRGREIQAWMDAHHVTADQVVILDDDNDMGPLLPRLIKTTWQDGLQAHHIDEALALLGISERVA